MIISELIKHLSDYKTKFGDLKVVIGDADTEWGLTPIHMVPVYYGSRKGKELFLWAEYHPSNTKSEVWLTWVSDFDKHKRGMMRNRVRNGP